MERRRKALGLRKLSSNDEEKAATSCVAKNTTSANVKNETEGNLLRFNVEPKVLGWRCILGTKGSKQELTRPR